MHDSSTFIRTLTLLLLHLVMTTIVSIIMKYCYGLALFQGLGVVKMAVIWWPPPLISLPHSSLEHEWVTRQRPFRINFQYYLTKLHSSKPISSLYISLLTPRAQ